ncbi:MAG: alpha/beta fold hydrolase [Alphaproteobacteria bacterium]|nr:alpha/beta fold hydrolase [Alphaproteobacteria bacterium]
MTLIWMAEAITRSAYADLGDAQVHYRYAGAAGPAVVCFHQTPLSSRMYERALPHLGRDLRAFAFDTPGYGGSTSLTGEPTVAGFARQMVEAIDAIGLARVAVCGFATGSAVAVEVARQIGDRATHLILSGTPVLSEARMKMFADRLGEPHLSDDGDHLQQVWDSRVENFGRGGDLEQVQMAVSETLRVYDRYHWGLLAVSRYDLRAALRGLKLPALFITAEHDKLAAENREAAQLVSGAREIVLAGAQPQVCWTDPKRYAEEVIRFVGAL